ncbi:palmitoyltransferase ZDHHC16, partial [Nephila pilipes]
FNSISPVVVEFVKAVSSHFLYKPPFKQEPNVLQEDLLSNSTSKLSEWPKALYHSCIVYGALLCVAVLFVLGGLLAWHARLISRGETSIESHINKKETARLLKEGKIYENPYNYGIAKNWKIFLSVGYQSPQSQRHPAPFVNMSPAVQSPCGKTWRFWMQRSLWVLGTSFLHW